ncbi:MAG: hypothetical protein AB1782_06530, partial [Cyanobacteriota bacterium]
MRKKVGASLSQYAILLGVLLLILIPAFFAMGDIIYSNFNHFLNVLKGNSETVASSSTAPGESSAITITNGNGKTNPGIGSPEDPIKTCVDKTCTLDFGEFILTGLPEDFDEYVEASGTSGGTEKLFALLEQIAQQLEDEGDTTGAQQYRDLANLGHFIANVQKEVENVASTSVGASNELQDLSTKLSTVPSITIPDNIKSLIPDFDISKSIHYMSFDSRLDYAKYNETQKTAAELEDLKKSSLGYATFALYSDIMNNPKYSDSMKSVTKELINNINTINTKQFGQLNTSSNWNSTEYYSVYNLDTGEKASVYTPVAS